MTRCTAIKFCGLTRREDIDAALAVGVDYIGLVMAAGSSREVSVAQARLLAQSARETDPSVRIVALVRNASRLFIDEVVARVAPDVLQFHGDEDEPTCVESVHPYWKAIGMDGSDPVTESARFPSAQALLLDAHGLGAAGGTGRAFDWSRWPVLDRWLVLAGGLHPGNVAEAIRATRPFAVDVSSGIESAPGIKDVAAMRAFADAVRAVDRLLADVADPIGHVRGR